jgi:DNA-binding Xre family transcriptional regulator
MTMPANRISYNKLWKLLIDKKMTKSELKQVSGISTTSLAKLGKGENLTTDVLLKICSALNCDVTDIMEIEKEQNES